MRKNKHYQSTRGGGDLHHIKGKHQPTAEEMETLRSLGQQLSAKLGFDLPLPQQHPSEIETPKPTFTPLPRRTRRHIPWRAVATYTMGAAAAVLLTFMALPQLLRSAHEDAQIQGSDIIAEAPIERQIISGSDLRHIKLPDGTHLYLNKETTLSLRKGKFNAHTREIWLDEGEAFFEVAKDPDRPFIVHTPDGLSVKVLGTSFNIRAYPQLQDQVVSVRTGKVMVRHAEESAIYLTAHDAVTYSPEEGHFTPSTVDAELIAVWRNGEIHFQDATIHEVALRLQQVRGLELHGLDAIPTDARINAHYTTRNTNREIATALSITYGLRYSLKDNKLTFY